MARARNIKPALFKNELLGVADPLITLLFQSLWTLADKEGRLEDRPLRIKAETFPYRDGLDINGYLTELQRLGFIVRYVVGSNALIQVVNFKKHQTPHNTEKPSELPPVEAGTVIGSALQDASVKSPLSNGGKTVPLPPDSLIPDSLNTDSLIPDSLKLIPLVTGAEKSAPPPKTEIAVSAKPETELQVACRATWKSYSDAFFNRYRTEPVRNKTVNSQVKSFVQRIGADESPLVASHFLLNNSQWYVSKGHTFGALLADAEKLRTEWATGQTITSTRARQVDKSQANFSVVAEAMKILEGENHAKTA